MTNGHQKCWMQFIIVKVRTSIVNRPYKSCRWLYVPDDHFIPHSTRRRGGIAYPSYTRRCRRIGFPHLNRNRFAVVFVASYMLHSYHTRTIFAIDESTVYILTCTRCMPDTFNYEYIEFFIFVFRISILHIQSYARCFLVAVVVMVQQMRTGIAPVLFLTTR